MKTIKGILLSLSLVITFGWCVAPIIGAIDTMATDAEVTFFRSFWTLIWIIAAVGYRFKLRPQDVPRKIWNLRMSRYSAWIVGAGFLYFVSFFVGIVSFRLPDHMAPVLSLGNTPVLFVILFTWRRQTKLANLTAAVIAVAIIALFSPFSEGSWNKEIIWGLVGSVVFAGFLLAADKVSSKTPALLVIAWYAGVTTFCSSAGLLTPITQGFSRPLLSSTFHLQMFLLGGLTAFSLLIYMAALRYVSPFLVSFFLLFTAPANAIFDNLFLGNTLAPNEITGIVVTLVGMFTLSLLMLAQEEERRLAKEKEHLVQGAANGNDES